MLVVVKTNQYQQCNSNRKVCSNTNSLSKSWLPKEKKSVKFDNIVVLISMERIKMHRLRMVSMTGQMKMNSRPAVPRTTAATATAQTPPAVEVQQTLLTIHIKARSYMGKSTYNKCLISSSHPSSHLFKSLSSLAVTWSPLWNCNKRQMKNIKQPITAQSRRLSASYTEMNKINNTKLTANNLKAIMTIIERTKTVY